MAPTYSPLTINRNLEVSLRAIQTTEIRDQDARQALGVLLQSALQLEFATIPTYLSAAFSLTSNSKIYQLILRAAVEEMLHMTAVANLMNAIGVAPDIVAAVPDFPYHLTVLEPPLKLDLRSFSFDLVEDLFMRIEAPEDPVEFPTLAPAADRPRTIGQFYAGIIDIIETRHDSRPLRQRRARCVQAKGGCSEFHVDCISQQPGYRHIPAETGYRLQDHGQGIRCPASVMGRRSGRRFGAF